MVPAGDYLRALQAAGLPIQGMSLLDVTDPATWTFDGDLTPADLAKARAIVTTLTQAPVDVKPDPLTAEAVLGWRAMKFGVDPSTAALEVVSGLTVDPVAKGLPQ